jgi:hypothetical protein
MKLEELEVLVGTDTRVTVDCDDGSMVTGPVYQVTEDHPIGGSHYITIGRMPLRIESWDQCRIADPIKSIFDDSTRSI